MLRTYERRSVIRALTFAVALTLTYAGFILLPAGQQLDNSSFGAAPSTDGTIAVADFTRKAGVVVLIAACVIVGIMALLRKQVLAVAVAVVVVGGSVALADVLKLLIDRPRFGLDGYAENTFPSGHAALALSAAIALAVLVPASRWRRPVLLAASAVAVGVCWASVASLAHRPSDVIGGAMCVGLISAVLCRRRPTMLSGHPVIGRRLAAGIAIGLLLVIAGALLGDRNPVLDVFIDTPGWFLLTVLPASFAILCAPASPRTETRTETTEPA